MMLSKSEEIAGFERDIFDIKRDLSILKWMVALVIVVNVSTDQEPVLPLEPHPSVGGD